MRTHRIAVSTFFMVNGMFYASWAARLPELESQFGVSHAGLGTLLFVHAIGAVLAMPFTGWLTLRFGNDQLTRIGGWSYCVLPVLLPFLHHAWGAGLVFFLMGVASGTLDVSMNGQAVLVERGMEKPIMSSFHAMFSIGMALGAGLSAIMTALLIDIRWHFIGLGVVCLLAALVAARHLIKPPLVVRDPENKDPLFVLPTRALLPLGIIAFCGMTGEGAMADWSAIFMHEVVGQPKTFGAIAVGAFSAAMTLGRLLGDALIEAWGKSTVLKVSSLMAVLGLVMIVGLAATWTSLIGFFAVGLGLANVVPIIYSTAGNAPGVEPSVGIAMATTIGYSGFFVGPPAIGFLGDEFGLRLGLVLPLVLFLLMWWLVQRNRWES